MIIPRKRTISRRAALRGAGVALGLPWLEALTPAAFGASRTADAPVRLAVLYMPNGVNTGCGRRRAKDATTSFRRRSLHFAT
jgi:hypothetical protein